MDHSNVSWNLTGLTSLEEEFLERLIHTNPTCHSFFHLICQPRGRKITSKSPVNRSFFPNSHKSLFPPQGLLEQPLLPGPNTSEPSCHHGAPGGDFLFGLGTALPPPQRGTPRKPFQAEGCDGGYWKYLGREGKQLGWLGKVLGNWLSRVRCVTHTHRIYASKSIIYIIFRSVILQYNIWYYGDMISRRAKLNWPLLYS